MKNYNLRFIDNNMIIYHNQDNPSLWGMIGQDSSFYNSYFPFKDGKFQIDTHTSYVQNGTYRVPYSGIYTVMPYSIICPPIIKV